MTLAADLAEDTSYAARALYRIALDNAFPIFLALFTFLVVREHTRKQNMPPGPRGLPFIGNKHQVPSIKPWHKFAEWNKKYGACHEWSTAHVDDTQGVSCRAGGVAAPREHTCNRCVSRSAKLRGRTQSR